MSRRIDVPRNFEAALRKRGVAFTLTDDGRYELEQPAVIVSLDNLQRDVARDGNAKAIEVFVDRVLEPPDSRTWAQVRPFVRFSAEPNDLEFHYTTRTTVSRQVERVLTVTDRNETRIRWVTPAMLKAWKVSRREGQKAAGESLDRLLRGTRLQVETIGTMRLGMVPIDSAFKASDPVRYSFAMLTCPSWRCGGLSCLLSHLVQVTRPAEPAFDGRHARSPAGGTRGYVGEVRRDVLGARPSIPPEVPAEVIEQRRVFPDPNQDLITLHALASIADRSFSTAC